MGAGVVTLLFGLGLDLPVLHYGEVITLYIDSWYSKLSLKKKTKNNDLNINW